VDFFFHRVVHVIRLSFPVSPLGRFAWEELKLARSVYTASRRRAFASRELISGRVNIFSISRCIIAEKSLDSTDSSRPARDVSIPPIFLLLFLPLDISQPLLQACAGPCINCKGSLFYPKETPPPLSPPTFIDWRSRGFPRVTASSQRFDTGHRR